jgi:hypothetical protein
MVIVRRRNKSNVGETIRNNVVLCQTMSFFMLHWRDLGCVWFIASPCHTLCAIFLAPVWFACGSCGVAHRMDNILMHFDTTKHRKSSEQIHRRIFDVGIS